jgi:hypothetical protein
MRGAGMVARRVRRGAVLVPNAAPRAEALSRWRDVATACGQPGIKARRLRAGRGGALARRGMCRRDAMAGGWASRRTGALIFGRVAGRPALRCVDRAARQRRTMSR